jgi:hypothetical protein
MTTTTLRHIGPARSVPAPATPVTGRLRGDADRLVRAATATAVARLQPLLTRGRFHRPAVPTVATRLPDGDAIALQVLWGRDDADQWPPCTAGRPTSRWWRTGEEETGWPTATIDLVVTPAGDARAHLTALVDRAPGYDTSTNRVDKHLRDRIARTAIDELVEALVALLVDDLAASP